MHRHVISVLDVIVLKYRAPSLSSTTEGEAGYGADDAVIA
jgi:hypothetical protein